MYAFLGGKTYMAGYGWVKAKRTRSNRGRWLRHDEQDEDQGFHGKHAEGSLLAVPCLRLPHEEPFSSNGEKCNQPEQKTSCKRENSNSFCLYEGYFRCIPSSKKSDGSNPAERGIQQFPQNNAQVKRKMNARCAQSAPHRLISGKCGVHRKNMLDKLVVGIEISGVVENDKREEQSDGRKKK